MIGEYSKLPHELENHDLDIITNESGLKDATNTLNSISELHNKTTMPLKDQVAANFKERINPIGETIKSTGNFDVGKNSIEEKLLNQTKSKTSKNKVTGNKTKKSTK